MSASGRSIWPQVADTRGKTYALVASAFGRSKPLEGNRGARLLIDGMTQTRAMRKAATSSASRP